MWAQGKWHPPKKKPPKQKKKKKKAVNKIKLIFQGVKGCHFHKNRRTSEHKVLCQEIVKSLKLHRGVIEYANNGSNRITETRAQILALPFIR